MSCGNGVKCSEQNKRNVNEVSGKVGEHKMKVVVSRENHQRKETNLQWIFIKTLESDKTMIHR